MDGNAVWLHRGSITPVGNPAAGMEFGGNAGIKGAEICWTLGFKGFHHFGFIRKPSFADLGKIQAHLPGFWCLFISACLIQQRKKKLFESAAASKRFSPPFYLPLFFNGLNKEGNVSAKSSP